MTQENKKCTKCNQVRTYPYYELLIEEKHTREKKTFCLSCWKQEEKNYRKMSEKHFDFPIGYGLKYVHKFDDPGESSGVLITILHWVEELKQWRCGKNKDDYDEDIGTLEDKGKDNSPPPPQVLTKMKSWNTSRSMELNLSN